MTARPQDVALLPLPEEDGDLPRSGWWNGAPREGSDPCWLRESVEAYTRANVTAALASAQAREEGLRAEVERLEIVGRLHEGTAGLAINAVAAAEARNERLEEALRAARQKVYMGELPHGWTIDRIDAALTPNAAQPGETT